MSAMLVLVSFTVLFIKHFIIDFLWQGPFQYKNKGTYGHSGGLLHSGLHAVGTFVSLAYLVPTALPMLFLVSVVDFSAHYHIDWAKMNINKHLNWAANTHEEVWWLLGFDQLLHSLTYVGIILALLSV